LGRKGLPWRSRGDTLLFKRKGSQYLPSEKAASTEGDDGRKQLRLKTKGGMNFSNLERRASSVAMLKGGNKGQASDFEIKWGKKESYDSPVVLVRSPSSWVEGKKERKDGTSLWKSGKESDIQKVTFLAKERKGHQTRASREKENPDSWPRKFAMSPTKKGRRTQFIEMGVSSSLGRAGLTAPPRDSKKPAASKEMRRPTDSIYRDGEESLSSTSRRFCPYPLTKPSTLNGGRTTALWTLENTR